MRSITFIACLLASFIAGLIWNGQSAAQIAQSAGIVTMILLIVGLTSPRTVLVRNDFGIAALLPTPYVNREGGGLRMVGFF